MIPQARRRFIDVISLIESGQSQSFDHAVNSVHSQTNHLSKNNFWQQKYHFLKSVDKQPASYLQQYFNVSLETAQRWKETQWDTITSNPQTQKTKNLRGNKRSYTETQSESSSSIKEHSEPKRMRASNGYCSMSDNGGNQYLPLSSQSCGTLKYQFPLNCSDLLDSLYGGSRPIFNQQERIPLKQKCNSYDVANCWVRTFKKEVKQKLLIRKISIK